MASRKVLGYGGVAAAGGVAYYLYNAGGDPKLAEKKMEHDAATAARKIKGDLPGRDKEAKKAGEEGYEELRSKAQDLSEQMKAEGRKADQKLDAYRQDAEKKLEHARVEAKTKANQAVDSFDKNVTQGVSKTKGWFSGWFG